MVKFFSGLLRSVDNEGNTIITYPITTKDNITDLEEATQNEAGLLGPADKAKLDKVSYAIGSDDNGIFIETL